MLEKQVEEGKSHWAKGGFLSANVEQTAIANHHSVGKTSALVAIVEMDYEGFVGASDAE